MAKTDTTARPGRWLRVALAVSVALNLAVAGVVIGALIKGPPEHGRMSQPRDLAQPFTRALSQDERRALRRDLLREIRQMPDDEGRPSRAYREALDLLRAEPYDPDAVDALMTRQADRARERLEVGQRVLGRHLSEMSPGDRRAYADRLEEQLDGFERRTREWREKRD